MKVTRDTPAHLIIEDKPVWLGFVTAGITLLFTALALSIVFSGDWTGAYLLIGACVGVLIMLAFVRRLQVIFDRQARTVTIRRKSFFGRSEVIHGLDEVKSVMLQGGGAKRVVLELEGQSAGDHPLLGINGDENAQFDVAEAINRWLQDTRSPAEQV